MSSDKDFHEKPNHAVTGPLDSMATANRDNLTQASNQNGRLNSEGLVQLFAWSGEFTRRFLDSKPASPMQQNGQQANMLQPNTNKQMQEYG